MSKFATYTPLLKAKLEALEESTGVLLFKEVRYGYKKDFEGFPTAEFYKKAGSGEVADTHKTERIWEYTLLLIYNFDDELTERKDAELILDTTVDKVMEAFDEDQDLGGACQKIEVLPVNFYDILIEEPFIFAEFTIRIRDFINRH